MKLRARHKVARSLAWVLTMLVSSVAVPAQVSNPQPAHRAISRYKRPTLDDQVEYLAKYLDLDDRQRSSLKAILVQRAQEIFAMRHAQSAAADAPIDRFRAIEDRTVERIRATLNEEQRKKYDPLSERNSPSALQQQSVDDWLKRARPQ
jgi:hypothetical protein